MKLKLFNYISLLFVLSTSSCFYFNRTVMASYKVPIREIPEIEIPKKISWEPNKKNVFPIVENDKERIFDCPESYANTEPQELKFRFPFLNYFSNSPHYKIEHYVTEVNKFPFVLSYINKERLTKNSGIFVAMRGDGTGFHKAEATPGLMEMVKNHKESMLVLLDEYKYVDDEPRIKDGKIMTLCHRRHYPSGYIGSENPSLKNGGGWELMKNIIPETENIILVTYSNATTPRTEFIARNNKKGYYPKFYEVKNPEEFLKEYMSKTTLANKNSLKVRGFIDIEGNFDPGKPVWDLLAYLKEHVYNSNDKFFYATARVDKRDAYPVHVLMVKALGLEGKEDDDGVVTYQNFNGNIVIEIVTNQQEPYYSNNNLDLRTATNMFAVASEIKRLPLTHYNIFPWAMKRIPQKYSGLVRTNERKIRAKVASM